MPRLLNLVGLAGVVMLGLTTAAVAQHAPGPPAPGSSGLESPESSPDAHAAMGRDRGEASLVEDLAELRAKVARLEAALERDHQSRAGHGDAGMGMDKDMRMGGGGMGGMKGMTMGDGMKGMKDMDMGDGMAMPAADGSMKMGMGGMKGGSGEMSGSDTSMKMGMDGMGMGEMGGMMMMGKMKGMSRGMSGGGASGGGGMAMNSALPGFPGASHLYHIGATGFFLDHGEHVSLTREQVVSLNGIKREHLLAANTTGRQIEEAEQQLWELTAADSPDAQRIEEKIREIERLRGDRRLGFIRAVGEAAEVLTAEQRQTLMGMHPSPEAAAPSSADTPPASDDAPHQH
jgi:Spy/CpxP family protein refolding chaperone